jgi:hypothetical protein
VFALGGGDDPSGAVEDNKSGARRALINRAYVAGHSARAYNLALGARLNPILERFAAEDLVEQE